eukprot:g23991.t1
MKSPSCACQRPPPLEHSRLTAPNIYQGKTRGQEDNIGGPVLDEGASYRSFHQDSYLLVARVHEHLCVKGVHASTTTCAKATPFAQRLPQSPLFCAELRIVQLTCDHAHSLSAAQRPLSRATSSGLFLELHLQASFSMPRAFFRSEWDCFAFSQVSTQCLCCMYTNHGARMFCDILFSMLVVLSVVVHFASEQLRTFAGTKSNTTFS